MPATSTASVRSTSMPGKRGCAFSKSTSASKRSTSRPASSSIRATRSCTARSLPVMEGTRTRSCASRMQASVSSDCSALDSARSPIMRRASGEELLVAEVYELGRDVQRAGQTIDEVPERGAHRAALPEQEEEHEQREHPQAVGKNSHFDREPRRDDPEPVERWNRDQVQDHGAELHEHEEGERGPERLVAEWRGALEHQEWPADQDGEQEVGYGARGRCQAAPSAVANGLLGQVDRASGDTDAAEQKKHDWQADAQQRMEVLQRVQ